ncbi:MAG: helix-turn-helix domain-containing protein [Clostridia bacterium]|nr:helix-turn-helix domain-containing protein [Clostridia bacterium]
MSHSATPEYREYHLTIGDANFFFISDTNFIAESQHLGVTMHSHKFYELFYVLNGSMILVTEHGNTQLNEGDFACISPGVTHTTIIHPNSKRLEMVFSLERSSSKTNHKYYQAYKTIFKKKTLHIPSFSGANAFKRLVRYFTSEHPDKNELIIACLHEIMILMKATQNTEDSPLEMMNVEDSNNYRNYLIDEYFVNKFQHASLSNLAHLLHLSPQQTQRIIKNIYHQTFTERVTQMRMEYAKKLLSESRLSVSQIATECGYTGSNGFFVAFKKHFGTTPKEMRKKLEPQMDEMRSNFPGL